MRDEGVRRFSRVFQEALDNDTIKKKIPLLSEFDEIVGFRAVVRDNDSSPLTRRDFDSQMERNPKKYEDERDDMEYYSCSCWDDKEKMIRNNKMFKDKRWRIAKGVVRDCNGAISRKQGDSHIHWFLYEDATPEEDFAIV